MRDQFSTLDICKVLKIDRERLRDWMNRKYIMPSIQKAQGQGTKALFNKNDIYAIALFTYLIELGWSRGSAATIIQQLAKQELEKMPVIYFHFGYADPEELKAMLKPYVKDAIKHDESNFVAIPTEKFSPDWEFVTIINFNRIKKNVDAELLRLED